MPVLCQLFSFTLPSFICQFYDTGWYKVYSVYSRIIQNARFLKKYSTGWSQACSTSHKKYEFSSNNELFSRYCMQYAICSNAEFCNLSCRTLVMQNRLVSYTHKPVLQQQPGNLILIFNLCLRHFKCHNNSEYVIELKF